MKIIRIDKREISCNIEEFADQHHLIMEVEISTKSNGKDLFRAGFRGTRIKRSKPPVEIEIVGTGETEFETIEDYAAEISGSILLLDKDRGAYENAEIKVPALFYAGDLPDYE